MIRAHPPRLPAMLLLSLAVLVAAAPVRADLPPAKPAPAGDPRRGPRLEYERGPAECLSEAAFRSEVAIAVQDGVDHLSAGSPDVVRVRFEKIPGGYRGTIEYTDPTGAKDEPEVQTSYNCEILGRWVASSVSETVPRAPPCPPPSPCPACEACPTCGTPKPPAPCPAPPKPPPWHMDLSVGLNTYVMMTAFFSSSVGPAVGVAGEVRGSIFGITGEFRVVLPSRTYATEPVPGTTSSFPQELDVSQLSALVVPCARYKYFVGCGVAQLGGIIFKSRVDLETSLSYAFGPRIGFEVPFSEERFAVFGFGEVLFAPEPPGIDIVLPDPTKPNSPPANVQWTQPVASGFFGVGFSVRFK